MSSNQQIAVFDDFISSGKKSDLIVLDIMMETIFEGFNVVYELKANPEIIFFIICD